MSELVPNAVVVRTEALSGCLFRLWVRPDWPVSDADFHAGQFVRLAAPTEGSDFKKEGRAYSFVGFADGAFEFYVVEIPDGLQTPRLRTLKTGDRLWCEQKINGHFTLEMNPPGKDLWLIATGAGIAPIMAMLRHGAKELARYERIAVVHQVREADHLAYGAEIAAKCAADPRLRYVPILSKPADPVTVRDGHVCLTGRVGERVGDGTLEGAVGATFDPARSVVMLSSNPDMIKDVRDRLAARGLKAHKKREPGHVVSERYW